MSANRYEYTSSNDRYEDLLDRVAQDAGVRHGAVTEPVEPEEFMLRDFEKVKTIHSDEYRGSMPYRIGRFVASSLEEFFKDTKGRS